MDRFQPGFQPLMLTSLDEPSTIDDFDDSDAFQESTDSSHHPVAVESKVPNHLLLVSLLESLVASYEKDPTRRKKMFRIICRHLDDMNVIPSWDFIENFSSLRAQYSSIVHSMMMAVTNMMDKQATSNFLSLPSTADERTFALLDKRDPLSPHTPAIRAEEVLRSQSSRYKTEFNEIAKIGKGGFGSVFKVQNKLDQKEYAVKKIELKQKHPESARKVLREVQLLASLDHPNIVGYNAAWIEAEPVHIHKTKAWALPVDERYERKSPRIQFNRSNSHNGDYFSEPLLQSPPSTASTITATPLPSPPSNVHQFEKYPLTPESLSKTPKAIPRSTPEHSFDQPRSVMRTTLTDVSEMKSLKITETVSRTRSNSSEKSKSEDSMDDILSIHGVCRQSKKTSRTKFEYDSSSKSDVDELEINKVEILSSYSKYETEEDLSIRFEESAHFDAGSENYSSQVQYEKMDYNYESKTVEHNYHMTTMTELEDEQNDAAMAIVPHKPTMLSNVLSGHFGLPSLSKKSRIRKSYNCLESEDQRLHDGKYLAKRYQLGRRAVSFDPSSEVSRSEGRLLAKSNLFAGLSVVLYIQMQLCSRTLSGWLKERNEEAAALSDSFDAVDVHRNMQIFEGLLKGVQYIHSNGFMHRDLKPKNIFIEGNNMQVRIGDFGLARHDVLERSKSVGDPDYPLTPFDNVTKWDFLSSGTMHTSGVGTATYASPEQLDGSHYDSKSDMYSAGIILFELFHPFTTGMERANCIRDLRQGQVANEVWKRWPKQSAIIEKLVAADRKDRPTADEVLHSELFVSKDEMISSLKSQLAEMSKLLKQKQVENVEKNAELREARLKLKEKDALILELLNSRSHAPSPR